MVAVGAERDTNFVSSAVVREDSVSFRGIIPSGTGASGLPSALEVDAEAGAPTGVTLGCSAGGIAGGKSSSWSGPSTGARPSEDVVLSVVPGAIVDIGSVATCWDVTAVAGVSAAKLWRSASWYTVPQSESGLGMPGNIAIESIWARGAKNDPSRRGKWGTRKRKVWHVLEGINVEPVD